MHDAVLDWVARHTHDVPADACVIDVGGRDINGHPGHLFGADACFEVIDLRDGPRVTWVGDVLGYCTDDPFDVGLYLEVAEHTPDWPAHVAHIADLLHPHHGVFIFTAAGPGRNPHSAVDGGTLQPDEHYANVDPDELATVLYGSFDKFVVDVAGADVRAAAWR